MLKNLRCLFCKNPSDESNSVEHIVPESIGNLSHTLPKGVVCDTCNNYFARKVEKQFLEYEGIKLLRFRQFIPNKKGNIPPATVLVNGKYPAIARMETKGEYVGYIELSEEAITEVMKEEKGSIMFSAETEVPNGLIISRFLAKVALEAMAERLINAPGGIDYLIDEKQLDKIRNHARKGETKEWPVNVRRIYDENNSSYTKEGDSVQIVHEYDIMQTKEGELYFILVLFGLEFVINYGGPDIDGYLEWLKENNYESPLYTGKNKGLI